MKWMIVLLSLGLAACTNWDQAEDQRCLDAGYAQGTDLYLQCREVLATQRINRAMVLTNVGNRPCHSCAAIPSFNTSGFQNCRTVKVNNVLRTNCF